MTSGEPPTSPSAAKIGGYALIGAGALSAVLGLTTLVSGGSDDAAAPPVDQQQTEAPLPPLPPLPASSEEPPPSSSIAQPPPAADEPPPMPDPEPQAPPVDQPRPEVPDAEHGRQHIVVRVYNNSTIKGLAHRAADDFRSVGYEVPEVGNYARGIIPTTTVYYRPGTAEEAQAKEVAAAFQARAEPRFEGVGDASPGVIAIITNDYKGLGKGGK
ncbi:LytR C-terminal domain-containing protein [Saccharopolyspora sp. NFXS83]|uniref:LytR C-terminal domain-containing protein n=1 Tax=Saccharopolyspora sp. NFXS83 TaxID=2993560 RepID=UPI00224AF12F|nr:LytR C-terminal domain-containing protein [Saccharopolyspora sp. NFXS83]MCX2734375.1 LytR C-terminal domain-containing protein [Saccharopolyspora sp. NFXS83]